jgi:hypothetical protein
MVVKRGKYVSVDIICKRYRDETLEDICGKGLRRSGVTCDGK